MCAVVLVVEGAMARSSLSTVYEFNVRKFADGMSGAVNGMRPDGRIDNTCMQSKEVWTGRWRRRDRRFSQGREAAVMGRP